MKLSYLMSAKAVVELILGIGFVLTPVNMMSPYGMTLNPAGAAMTQFYGATFIFAGITLWFARNATGSDSALRAIVLGVVVGNTIGFIVALLATLFGVMNALGWLPTTLYLVFGLGFAYFLLFTPITQGGAAKLKA